MSPCLNRVPRCDPCAKRLRPHQIQPTHPFAIEFPGTLIKDVVKRNLSGSYGLCGYRNGIGNSVWIWISVHRRGSAGQSKCTSGGVGSTGSVSSSLPEYVEHVSSILHGSTTLERSFRSDQKDVGKPCYYDRPFGRIILRCTTWVCQLSHIRIDIWILHARSYDNS